MNAADCFVVNSIFSAMSRTNADLVIFVVVTAFFAGTFFVFVATGVALFFVDAFLVAMEPRHERVVDQERFAATFFASVVLAGIDAASFGGDRCAIKDAPSSRVSAVVSMLGDLIAFCASFLIFGDVIDAGALGIAQFYVFP